MRQSVFDMFPTFSTRFEGRLNFMYLDIKRLVTTGIGNLVDPFSLARALPWRPKNESNRAATPEEVEAEWNFVKGDPDGRSQRGGGSFASVTALELSDDSVDELVRQKLTQMESSLKGRAEFAEFDDWPADAQLGLLSMAWAMGPGFRFPRFQAACQAKNFGAAAQESHMNDTNNPGLRPRNAANRQLFLSAAGVMDGGTDPNELHVP